MTDITRRQFVVTAVPVLAAAPRVLTAARYDLVIKGGRVIDSAAKLDTVRDIAIAGGRIAAIGVNIDGAEIIDARGKLVVPGLIDIHTHAARSNDSSALLLKDGVTGWIDAGSFGANNIADGVAVARASRQTGRLLINIGRAGIIPEGDTMNLANADVAAARDAIAKNRDFVVGVKARLSSSVAGAHDYEVLLRAQEAASAFNLPVMIHMGQTMSPMPTLLELLKRGDIVTHMFAPPPNAIVDEQGRVLPAVLAARKRGVIFDVGNGVAGHLRWDIVETVTKQRFWPDTISTDWNTMSRTTGVVDLPNCMSKMFNYGMSLPDIVASATVNAARAFPAFKGRGTLKVGAPADVALLELREGTFEFDDNYKNTVSGRQRLFPTGTTLLGGMRA